MQLGVIGLGTMGANLARNAARHGAKVAVYNRTVETMDEFMKEHGSEGDFVGCKTYEELKEALTPPRPILIMVKAGSAVDAVIEDLLPHLDKGDIIIDAGNSHYPDTERRVKELGEKGIRFVGMGVSGGEEGALNGPSMMPGGDESGYREVRTLLVSMSAMDGAEGKCVAYIGPGGAGHFVKMAHNGIEYAVMQLIAESYAILKHIGEFGNEQLAETFEAWSQSDDLQSFLLEVTAKVFRQKDDLTDADLIDVIKDAAGEKGTGKWTTQAAMELGVPIPTINAAVDARLLSASDRLRSRFANLPEKLDFTEPVPQQQKLASQVRAALELSSIIAYTQGFELMKHASEQWELNLNLSEVARIWRGGCIIRSAILQRFQNAYSDDATRELAAGDALRARFEEERQFDWRHMVDMATSRGIPIPALCASLTYFDAVRAERLPQNLIQAQRDFFGSHTYERIDKEGAFHTEWQR